MRLTRLIAASAVLLVVSACGDDPATPEPTATPPSTASTSATPDVPQTSAELELRPGGLGPVDVGMSTDDALATGLFDADVKRNPDACEGTSPLAFKKQYTGVDVFVGSDGSVSSLGVSDAEGPRTKADLGVGSTVGELIDAYGGGLMPKQDVGYGQVGMFVQDGDDWLGFLIGDAKTLDDTDNDPGLKVTFAEATSGEQPSLIRDGC